MINQSHQKNKKILKIKWQDMIVKAFVETINQSHEKNKFTPVSKDCDFVWERKNDRFTIVIQSNLSPDNNWLVAFSVLFFKKKLKLYATQPFSKP